MGKREPSVERLLELLKAKGVPVQVIGAERSAKIKPVAPAPEPEGRRGLPD
jgi:hypothetical protein